MIHIRRKYPVGLQDFEKIRRGGFVYVDKTELIYRMISEACPYFLSRPRRFGKSLLVSTLAAIFEGKRELFEAFTTENGVEQPQLFIATTDWKWERHAVLRFDFSMGDLNTIEQLDNLISDTLAGYERQYGVASPSADVNLRMKDLILEAERQTGRKVVVLCDEYDSQMLHAIGDKAKQEAVRHSFQNLFGPLKALDAHLQFVFITGISKFSQMGVFSKLNQLKNISLQANYEAICGISEKELTTTLRPDIEKLAEANGFDYDTMLTKLKANYDGYHFGRSLTDIYNPFSLFSAFDSGEVEDYWFASGTTRALIDMLAKMPPIDMANLENKPCDVTSFDVEFDTYQATLPVLYQSGYLTIKDYWRDSNMFMLGFPNSEVRRGFAVCLYLYVTHAQPDDHKRSAFQMAYHHFRMDGDLPPFITALQTFFAGVPYLLSNDNERHFQALLYTLLVSFGADVVAEEMTAQGRADIVLRMPRGIYILELKYDGTADEALWQIEERGYAAKYALDGRPVTKVGIAVGTKERNIVEWESEVVRSS